MDGILALGHFCETHGPCVILCTQRCEKEPQQFPHSLTVPVCEACQSIDLEQAIVSRDDKACYVTTRTPLQQDLAFLLKQAVVRSLSCEETSKEGGTLYFGDNERGHLISHIFTLQDSLARGFHRKYSILMLMRDRIHLLNSWPTLTKHIKRIATDLQDKATQINDVEQSQRPQRAVRQAQNSPNCVARSLSQLTGEPAVFAHLHLWFTWLLTVETVVEKPVKVPDLPVKCHSEKLREIATKMSREVFHVVFYCFLTGIRVETSDCELVETFKQILPQKFALPKSGDSCRVYKSEVSDEYAIEWNGHLPTKLPTLLTLGETALKDKNLPAAALEPFITSLVMQWYNIACAISWTPKTTPDLFKSLGVQKQDMPLLSYWVPQCSNN